MRDPSRLRMVGTDKLAEVESKRQEQLHRKGRPVWKKVNRLELLIACGIIALIAAWVLFLALS